MSEQISNNTGFNIYYSENNIPYNNDIKIEGAQSGIIVCKNDNLSYNLLFVNEGGYPYLLSEEVKKFIGVAPITLNNISDANEKEIKLNYDNSLLTITNNGKLTVDKNRLNSYYAPKSIEYDIEDLNKSITSLQEENSLLTSQIEILTKRFNALNIDKTEYYMASLDIYVESYKDKLCIIKPDGKTNVQRYKLTYSGLMEMILDPIYSYYEADKFNLYSDHDFDYGFIKQITEYSYNGKPNKIQKNTMAYMSIKNTYFENKSDKYYFCYFNNSFDDPVYSYFNNFNLVYTGKVGDVITLETNVYDLSSNKFDINKYDAIFLPYFHSYTFADYPYDYDQNRKIFCTYQYYPVDRFLPLYKIENFNIYNEDNMDNGYPTLKIIYSYFNDNDVLEDGYSTISPSQYPFVTDIYLDNNIKRLYSIKIYPSININGDDEIDFNSNLKLSANYEGYDMHFGIVIEEIETETNLKHTNNYYYSEYFDNFSSLELRFPEDSYYIKLNITLYNLFLSITDPNNKYIIPKTFNFSIHKNNYIDKNNKVDTSIEQL